MQVLVSGSRSIRDTEVIKETLVQTLPNDPNLTVIVGGAVGIDQEVAKYCIENRIDVDVMFADWDQYGKKAGMLRNLEMLAMNIDEVVVIWDGESRGTKHTLNAGLKRKFDTTVTVIGVE